MPLTGSRKLNIMSPVAPPIYQTENVPHGSSILNPLVLLVRYSVNQYINPAITPVVKLAHGKMTPPPAKEATAPTKNPFTP